MAEANLVRPDPLVFDKNVHESFAEFEEAWRIYAEAGLQGKSKKQKASFLLNFAGKDARTKAKSFVYAPEIKNDNGDVVTPAETKDDPEVLLKKFKEVCSIKVNVMMERHAFFERKQGNDKNGDPESFSAFLADVKIKATTCKFGDLQDEFIRDRIVCGVRDESVRKELFKEKDLDLARAIAICRANEQSDKHIKDLKKAEQDVHAVHYNRSNARRNRKHQPSQQPRQNKQEQKSTNGCYKCGSKQMHKREECPAFGQQCSKCLKWNHYAKMCLSMVNDTQQKGQNQQRSQGYQQRRRKVDDLADEYFYEDEDEEQFEIGSIELQYNVDEMTTKDELYTTLSLDGNQIKLKVDTGARCNVLTTSMLERMKTSKTINTANKVRLVAYSGDSFTTEGTIKLCCPDRHGKQHTLEFHVVNRDVKPLLGLHDTVKLKLIKLSEGIHELKNQPVEMTEYSDLFDTSKLGQLPVTYSMKLDPSATPIVCPPRRVPVAMTEKVKAELNRMVSIGVITPVTEPTQWVSSMVAAAKKNGEVRICIDPINLNKYLMRPHHPMKTIEEVMAQMPKATIFSTLDAKNGFWQIMLDEESSLLTTFNTPWGRYRFLRMPYGITTGSEVFQRAMEQIFSGYPCSVIVDDILIWGQNQKDHDEKLEKVLKRARQVGLTLNPQKCKFRVSEVTYVGHTLTNEGAKPDPEKTRAIEELAPPNDVQGLQRFLGMINYLSKFIPNYSELTAPLRSLLHKDAVWCWQDQHDAAYTALKKAIVQPQALQYYDPLKEVTLTGDASQNGLGAACLQEGKPVAYSSRAMTETEGRYAQIEKELLAVLFACNKFDHYIFGRRVTVETDHQPLITIMKKPLHMAPTRLQKMMMKLKRYNINLVYKRGKELYIADTLSRAYLPNDGTAEPEEEEYEVMAVMPMSNSRLKKLQNDTAEDKTCQIIKKLVKNGWPQHYKDVPISARPYHHIRDELSYENELVMRGTRVVVPKAQQQDIVKQLHKGHPGIEATKRRAKESLYWPEMCDDIKNEIQKCDPCNALAPHQQKEPMKMHEVPSLPWTITATDVFEWNGENYSVLVDSYSGWFEIDKLNNLTSTTIIKKLKKHFAAHGIPTEVMTDNARYYTSEQFEMFASDWGFDHITSSPKYPQSNGLAERAVQSAKAMMEKCRRDRTDPYLALLNLRNIPRGNLGSPAQRLMSRRLRNAIPMAKQLLTPITQKNVRTKLKNIRLQKKKHYDKSAKPLKQLNDQQKVRMQTDRGYDQEAEIVRHSNKPRSYVVQSNGKQYERNRRHLLPVIEESPSPEPSKIDHPNESPTTPTTPRKLAERPDSCSPSAVGTPAVTPNKSAETRRSGRSIIRPKYLEDFVP